MGKITSITAAIMILTVPWVCAGTFDVLAEASAVRAPTQHNLRPIPVLKAQFTPAMGPDSQMQTESDVLLPEQTQIPQLAQVTPRPAAAFKERSVGAMAPPPKTAAGKKPSAGKLVQKKEAPDPLELDLEKDLVISPPPAEPEAEEKPSVSTTPTVEPKGITPKERVRERRVDKKKAAPTVKPVTPLPLPEQYAASPKAIRKVRPLTRGAWSIPAGTHGPPPACPVRPDSFTAQTYHRAALPMDAPTQRYVRDGVTIKLAPSQVVEAQRVRERADEFGGPDVLSVAAEIIGLPFAFISSLF
jgi:hypothetical protein